MSSYLVVKDLAIVWTRFLDDRFSFIRRYLEIYPEGAEEAERELVQMAVDADTKRHYRSMPQRNLDILAYQ